jgi:hypothetical protein
MSSPGQRPPGAFPTAEDDVEDFELYMQAVHALDDEDPDEEEEDDDDDEEEDPDFEDEAQYDDMEDEEDDEEDDGDGMSAILPYLTPSQLD